ncbi:metal/formaldehyde-sensitive transcriptional repressor [Bosea sp. (in: a-proteobacteria)]|jgi:DNA-binding FrmR family transcriptional regulator|uniref:metal/formaldehyde-sensitive transcriptional repressor n=1 Tax=Bosea sp. (in: a-proteobacteria) TaxID=1871050 RepID=UPI002DDD376F|nr:metal/formaldehyde-sensitive transcriptional repressor [Bosea sp. (in: a-proteobacteria)]HEV2511371.1 metal/formaldehyde-sensitive transcriptional repressor [Bosea sp. (in: a-proteobacteria)]
MPHSPDDKKRAVARLRRIKGQAEALERAVEAGVDCSALLQQIAALRGAANGLMAEVLESHLRETFGLALGHGHRGDEQAGFEPEAELDEIIRMLRTYLK